MVMGHESVIFHSMSNCKDQPFCHKYLISIKSKAYPVCASFYNTFFVVGWCVIGEVFCCKNWFWRQIYSSWNKKVKCQIFQDYDIFVIEYSFIFMKLILRSIMHYIIHNCCKIVLINNSWKWAQKREITNFQYSLTR